jgi:hypothetical protein
MMRSKKAFMNTISSLFLQIVTIILGLIIPRLILKSFGSTANGLISSIGQFLGYIVLLEAGVGGVTRSALYKPLAENNTEKISGIVVATEQFFRKVSFFFIAYLLLMTCIFKTISQVEYSWIFTASLVLIIGISTFTQYYFGITNAILLTADQRTYIYNTIQVVTLVLNSSITILLILCGATLTIVKLTSAIVYILRPIALNIYVKRKYNIIKTCAPDNNAIKQRWDGFGHHIAFFVHSNIDVVIITIALGLKEVSVYSIYYMVISGIASLVTSVTSGMEAAFGNMIAKNELEALNRNFRIFELLTFSSVAVIFTTAGLLILPFITVYTKGIVDVNYFRPTFAVVLIAVQAAYCIRLPYKNATLAAGDYKATRNGAFAEAGINIVLSIATVFWLGITGVVLATLVAMLYRTGQYVIYCSKNILRRPISTFVRRQIITIINILSIIAVVKFALPDMGVSSLLEWFVLAIIVTTIAFAVTLVYNVILYRTDIHNTVSLIKKLCLVERE